MDVRLLPWLAREEFEEVFGAILREGLAAVRRVQVTPRIPWVEIEPDEPMQISVDGEPLEGSRFRFEVVERVLQAKLPRGCPLLRDAAPANEPGGQRR